MPAGSGDKTGRPPPVPPRPDKSVVAEALAKTRKMPPPVLTKIRQAKQDDRLPSPKLEGLARVKSFIRDVMTPRDRDDDKSGGLKSFIPIPLSPKSIRNRRSDESSKKAERESAVKARIIKSNSFADRAVPTRKAPPPPIGAKSPSPRTSPEKYPAWRLSASCEELNANPSRTVIYRSPETEVSFPASADIVRKLSEPNGEIFDSLTDDKSEKENGDFVSVRNEALLERFDSETCLANDKGSREKVYGRSFSANDSLKTNGKASVCNGVEVGNAGKTILIVNKDGITKGDNRTSPSRRHVDDEANHELLISELQDMHRDQVIPTSVSCSPNIQRSDWMHSEGDGSPVPYSSCQIVIEDPIPVDDSGIGSDVNDSQLSLSPSLVSRLKEQIENMSSLQGLPPLPKSLSGFNVSEPRADGAPVPPPVPPRTIRIPESPLQDSDGPVVNGDGHRQNRRKLTTLDTQLAILKREMLSLRQLDLSLLSQLWSLNESIHEFRQFMGDRGGQDNGPQGPGDLDDMDDDADDSSSGAEDGPLTTRTRPAPPPPPSHHHQPRGRTPV